MISEHADSPDTSSRGKLHAPSGISGSMARTSRLRSALKHPLRLRRQTALTARSFHRTAAMSRRLRRGQEGLEGSLPGSTVAMYSLLPCLASAALTCTKFHAELATEVYIMPKETEPRGAQQVKKSQWSQQLSEEMHRDQDADIAVMNSMHAAHEPSVLDLPIVHALCRASTTVVDFLLDINWGRASGGHLTLGQLVSGWACTLPEGPTATRQQALLLSGAALADAGRCAAPAVLGCRCFVQASRTCTACCCPTQNDSCEMTQRSVLTHLLARPGTLWQAHSHAIWHNMAQYGAIR